MIAGICYNDFKILLAGTSNLKIKFRYSDDAVIAMMSFLKFEIEISFLRLSHHLTLPTMYSEVP